MEIYAKVTFTFLAIINVFFMLISGNNEEKKSFLCVVVATIVGIVLLNVFC